MDMWASGSYIPSSFLVWLKDVLLVPLAIAALD